MTAADGSTREVPDLSAFDGAGAYGPFDKDGGAARFVVVSTRDGASVWATGTCGEVNAVNASAVERRDAGPGLSIGCESSGTSAGESDLVW